MKKLENMKTDKNGVRLSELLGFDHVRHLPSQPKDEAKLIDEAARMLNKVGNEVPS